MEPCHWSQGRHNMLGVSLRESRATTHVMLGVSLRARWDATLVHIIVHAVLVTVFDVAYIFSDSGYSIYFLLFFPFNNNNI